MADPDSRRPLASRDTGLAKRAATWLTESNVTPNQISMACIGFAALAGGLFWISGSAGDVLRGLLLILAAVAVQGRLICNLLDGMVAVEGGKSAPDGPFWNEAPDRFADILILVGLGFGAGAPTLGSIAAIMAVLTAYIRELGRAEGAPSDFSGPMAKQHRMAVVTICAILAVFERLVFQGDMLLLVALYAVAIGALFTSLRRSATLIRHLKDRG
jgi:phosphatidylglycerophosphate synthase